MSLKPLLAVPTQRTLSCKVDNSFLSQVDQQAQEQGLTRQDWVKQAIQTMMSGTPAPASDHSGQIVELLQGLNQRLARIEEQDAQLAATTSPAPVADERIEQVLQWLQVLGQRLQRLEEKEEEPMITQAELIAPDERIDQILQMMQGLGQQVRQLEAHTEDAIATLRPAIEASSAKTTTRPSTPTSTTVNTEPAQPEGHANTAATEIPKETESDLPIAPVDLEPIDLDGLLSLEQIYDQTQLDRSAILFFANYLGISEIEAVETRTYWQYDYIEGGFRRRV